MIIWMQGTERQRDKGDSREGVGDYKGTQTIETPTKCTIDILNLMRTAAGLRPQDKAKQSKAKRSQAKHSTAQYSKAKPHPQNQSKAACTECTRPLNYHLSKER
jgi:hypothetical protein